MSLVQMARSLSITHDALSKIERGCRSPSFHVAVEIAAALGVGLDELLTGTKVEPCQRG